MKKTAEMTAAENTTATQETTANAAPHPAEVEAAQLRVALADERIKTEALSRRCIRLGEALDEALLAEDIQIEADMLNVVNRHNRRYEAMRVANIRRKAQAKKAAMAYAKACKRNALSMSIAFAASFTAIALGIVGFIPHVAAAIVAGISLVAFGWTLSDFAYLLRRCGK